MKNLLKEPLFHFVLIGFGLFLLYGWVSDRNDSQETIYFDDYDMNNIIASWEMQWKRLPTDEELKSLVEQNIRQEVFYQEALKMNLDHNDEIIKRRLAQKMNFLSNDLATLKEPTEDELRKYYEDNLEKYMLSPIYSFYQISFRSDSRADPQADALQFLEKIKDSAPQMLSDSGDRLPFPYYFETIDSQGLDRQLGMEFARSLEGLDTGIWTGPVRSGFGWHLVYFGGSFLLELLLVPAWSSNDLGPPIVLLAFWVVGIGIFGILDVITGIIILRRRQEFSMAVKVFAIVILLIGVFEATIILVPFTLLLVPVSYIVLAFVFFSGVDEVEIV